MTKNRCARLPVVIRAWGKLQEGDAEGCISGAAGSECPLSAIRLVHEGEDLKDDEAGVLQDVSIVASCVEPSFPPRDKGE